MTVVDRIAAAGIALPAPLVPLAKYVAHIRTGPYLYISGQVSMDDAGGITGTIGRDLDLADGIRAARLCGVNLLAQIGDALDGDFGRVARIVKLGGYVQVAEDFSAIPQVMNGCSDLMVEVFGERGYHTRSSIGAFRLPRNCAVEVDAVIEIEA